MWWPDLSLFYIGCTLEHILQNKTIIRFLAIFWRLTFSGHILTRLSRVLCMLMFNNENDLAYFRLNYVAGRDLVLLAVHSECLFFFKFQFTAPMSKTCRRVWYFRWNLKLKQILLYSLLNFMIICQIKTSQQMTYAALTILLSSPAIVHVFKTISVMHRLRNLVSKFTIKKNVAEWTITTRNDYKCCRMITNTLDMLISQIKKVFSLTFWKK
jgi:hypothetical protein